MAKSDNEAPPRRPATKVARLGRESHLTGPFVNPPVVHASTVLFQTTDDMIEGRQRYLYGRRGTPTSEALESAINELDGAAGTVICPSGLSAAATALQSCLRNGDNILVTDSVYEPVRRLLERTLEPFGITTTFYDPLIGAGVAALFQPNTKAIYTEAPGSLTFEMQDIPAIVEAAKKQNLIVLTDNTWATSLGFRPLAIGVDITIVAATKHIGGHSDLMLGLVSANQRTWPALKRTHGDLGLFAGPDDISNALRGLRTMPLRLERSTASGLSVARWLERRSEVARVLFPALESDPGHALWKRDMNGGCGLFGVVFKGWTEERAKRFIDSLALFGIGASWGGFESLAILARPARARTATAWEPEGPLVRIYIGLEDPDDLIADLESAFLKSA
jgi:cystathionine beta-lyase